MSGVTTFKAMWPIEDEDTVYEELIAEAVADLPALAARHGVLVDSRAVRWAVRERAEAPGAPGDSDLVLEGVMPAVRTQRPAAIVEALNWDGTPPWSEIAKRHSLDFRRLRTDTTKAALTLAESQVCMALAHHGLWRHHRGILRPLAEVS